MTLINRDAILLKLQNLKNAKSAPISVEITLLAEEPLYIWITKDGTTYSKHALKRWLGVLEPGERLLGWSDEPEHEQIAVHHLYLLEDEQEGLVTFATDEWPIGFRAVIGSEVLEELEA